MVASDAVSNWCVRAAVLISLLSTLCIAAILAVTLGSLVLLGWHRGLIASIIISAAIGMAVDFAAHLGFAYRQANSQREASTREGLVRLAVGRMAPALSAAAASTACMGGFMVQGGTAFTTELGLFILLLMAAGWVLGFFFLMPLLVMVGPVGASGGELSVAALRRVVRGGRALEEEGEAPTVAPLWSLSERGGGEGVLQPANPSVL